MPHRKHIASMLIGCALLLQLAGPLGYYLGSDPFDERFAWRMFSGLRVTPCHAQVFEERNGKLTPLVLTGRAQGPHGALHPAWRHLIERNRTVVIEKFMTTRCTEPNTTRITLISRCRLFDARKHDLIWTRTCASGLSTQPTRAALEAVRKPPR